MLYLSYKQKRISIHDTKISFVTFLQPDDEKFMLPDDPLLVTGSRYHSLCVWKLPLMNKDDEPENDIVGQQAQDSNEVD